MPHHSTPTSLPNLRDGTLPHLDLHACHTVAGTSKPVSYTSAQTHKPLLIPILLERSSQVRNRRSGIAPIASATSNWLGILLRLRRSIGRPNAWLGIVTPTRTQGSNHISVEEVHEQSCLTSGRLNLNREFQAPIRDLILTYQWLKYPGTKKRRTLHKPKNDNVIFSLGWGHPWLEFSVHLGL